MKSNELKVGDRVKYKLSFSDYSYDEYISIAYPTGGEGIIKELDEQYVTLENGHKFWKSYIISKLEPLPPEYKQIPIEKEENPYWMLVNKTMSHSYSTPTTTYH